MSNYLSLLGEMNNLPPVDVAFFIICAVLILLIVGVYFLIPVINKKQYREQRENLQKREEAFKINKQKQFNGDAAAEETVEQPSPDAADKDGE